jgi:molybdate transport system regulatory protein
MKDDTRNVMREGKKKGQRRLLVPRLRVMWGNEIAFGPGKVELLKHIQSSGSILKAAKAMNMSYMRAWKLLKTTENCFRQPLVTKSRGGKGGGNARLTVAGEKALGLYEKMENECLNATCQSWEALLRELK